MNNLLSKGSRELSSRALLFDSWYDRYKGVALLVALQDGKLSVGDQISLAHQDKSYEIKEIGILSPFPTPLKSM